MSRIISKGRQSAPKGQCNINTKDLLEFGSNLILLIHPSEEAQKNKPTPDYWLNSCQKIVNSFRKNSFFLLNPLYDGQDHIRFKHLSKISQDLCIPTIASAAPLMHIGNRRKLTDILTCIRNNLQVEKLGYSAQTNSEKRLRNHSEMLTIFKGFEESVYRTNEVSDLCNFS